MAKDGEIILVEATDIMRSLPSEMQQDDQIMDSVIASLKSGVDKLVARQDALEIAQIKLQQTVAHGFGLVNNEIQGMKHEAEKDRIHANYARKDAEAAKAIAEKAWERTQSLAVEIARTDQKAEGAKELAKSSRWANFDPLTGMVICGALVLLGMIAFMRVEVKEQNSAPAAAKQDEYRCGIQVACDVRPIDQRPARGGV